MTRSATPPRTNTETFELDVLGYLIMAGILLLLLPLLAFVALAWLVSRVFGGRSSPRGRTPG